MNLFMKVALLFVSTVALCFGASERGREAYEAGLTAYETDPGAAVSLFMMAVAKGSVEAMMAGAHCCEEGRGVPENYGFAMMWRMNALRKDPVRACVGMAQMDSLWHGIREDDLEERRARFELHAPDVDTAFAYVNQLLSEGQQAEAEDMLERAIVKFPPDARLLFARGVMCRSRWSKSTAKIYFKGLQILEPDSYRARAVEAALKMDESASFFSVSPALKTEVKEQPDDIFLRWLLAVYCRACNKHDPDSVRSYKWILKRWDPGPVMVHQSYANELSERLGRHEQALAHREIAVRQAERSWTCQGIANTLFRLHRYQEAEPYYARVVELDDEDPKNFYQWGRCLVRLERFAEAEVQLRRAIEMKPVGLYKCELGFSLLGGGKYEEALNTFEWVDEHQKRDDDELWGLAQIYRDGLGVERNDARANEYLVRLHGSKTADEGPKLIPIQNRRWRITGSVAVEDLGESFYYGKFKMPINFGRAAVFFMAAAKGKKPIGACGLVQVYAEGGHGIQRDIPAALEWFAWLEEQNPKDYLRSPAAAEVVWIYMGRYGAAFANSREAVRIANAIYVVNDISANGVLLARALAFDGQFPAAAKLMCELVQRAEANGHHRGMEEKKGLLALYESGEMEEIILSSPPKSEGGKTVAGLRPADLNKPKPAMIMAQSKPPVVVLEQPRSYPSGEQGLIEKGRDYQSGKHSLDKDGTKALECYVQAYDMNGEKKISAARDIAALYKNGAPGLEANFEMAEEWYLRAHDLGDDRALTRCIMLYYSMKGREMLNSAKAVAFADKVMSNDTVDGVGCRLSAMVYADVGRFDDAVKAQERAIVLTDNRKEYSASEKYKERLRIELESYKRGEIPPDEGE